MDVERLLQAHALQELQLGALDDTIKRLARAGAGDHASAAQLRGALDSLTDDYTG